MSVARECDCPQDRLVRQVAPITGQVTWRCPDCGTAHIMFPEDWEEEEDGPE